MVKNGFFLSYWESGVMFRAPCQVDTETRRVYDIMNVGHPGNDDELLCENVEVDGIENTIVNIDEVLMLEEENYAFQRLHDVKQAHNYWYSHSGKMLDVVLDKLTQE